MKKVLTSVIVMALFSISLFAQNGPKIQFDSESVDYGTIEINSEPFRTLKFTNAGDEPLVIKNVRGNCGCTVPTWPRDAIMPGQTEELKVRYTTNRPGRINKRITVTTNEPQGANIHQISVIGEILRPDDAAGVPQNKGTILNSPTR